MAMSSRREASSSKGRASRGTSFSQVGRSVTGASAPDRPGSAAADAAKATPKSLPKARAAAAPKAGATPQGATQRRSTGGIAGFSSAASSSSGPRKELAALGEAGKGEGAVRGAELPKAKPASPSQAGAALEAATQRLTKAVLSELASLGSAPLEVKRVIEGLGYLFGEKGVALLASRGRCLTSIKGFRAKADRGEVSSKSAEQARAALRSPSGEDLTEACLLRKSHAAGILFAWVSAAVDYVCQAAALSGTNTECDADVRVVSQCIEDRHEVCQADILKLPMLRGHPHLGLSVRYLSGVFLNKVVKAKFPLEATVDDVEPTLIRPQGEGVTCPRDGRPGASYVDSMGEDPDNVGVATFMLSYTWGNAVADIADTLVHHCKDRGLDPARTYVWICCFCINQHRVKEKQNAGEVVPFEEFRQAFKDRVEGISQVLAMMTPWHAPKYITRVWCDFELYTAMHLDKKVTVAMPPREAEAMLEAMRVGKDNFSQMWQVLGALDVQKADASVPEDKERILGMIQESPGFRVFNEVVTKYLQEWMVSTCEAYLSERLRDRDLGEMEIARACDRVGQLLMKVGRPARALQMFSDSVKIIRAEGEDPAWMSVALFNLAGAKRHLGDINGANADYDEAKKLQRQGGGSNCMQWRDRLSEGLVKLNMRNFGAALADLSEAKDLLADEPDQTLQARGLVTTLMNIGTANAESKDFDGAMEAFKAAQEEVKRGGLSQTPEEATLQQNIGSLHARIGNVKSAVASYEAAHRTLGRLGLLESSDGAMLLVNLGISAWSARNAELAWASAQRAQSIFAQLDMSETRHAKQAAQLADMAKQMLSVAMAEQNISHERSPD